LVLNVSKYLNRVTIKSQATAKTTHMIFVLSLGLMEEVSPSTVSLWTTCS